MRRLRVKQNQNEQNQKDYNGLLRRYAKRRVALSAGENEAQLSGQLYGLRHKDELLETTASQAGGGSTE